MKGLGERRVSELAKDEGWSLVIQPKRSWISIDLRELYRYRDLIKLFVRRDFVTVYKQTILGPLWFILNPLFTTVIYTFVFGGLAKIPTDGVPPTIFYYGGTMLWGYFSACLNAAADTFSANGGLFGKVYFPRLTAPVGKVFSNLISVAIQFATLICFYAYFIAVGTPVRPTWLALSFPLLLAQLAILGTGFGMIVSALTTKYRDLRQVVGFGISLWMYVTPIVYPLSQVPQKYKWVVLANPVSVPIELFRQGFFGVGGIGWLSICISVAVTAVVLFVGLVLFHWSERNFIDVM
jgi:lipopolysaccharide transport system permease protein